MRFIVGEVALRPFLLFCLSDNHSNIAVRVVIYHPLLKHAMAPHREHIAFSVLSEGLSWLVTG
jgi:hypothetical protein